MKKGTIEYEGQLLEIETDRTHIQICAGLQDDGTTINCSGHPYRVSRDKKKLKAAQSQSNYGYYHISMANLAVSEKFWSVHFEEMGS